MGRRVGSKEDSMGKMGNNLPPKRKGGLGIKDVRTFNKALLGKWRWDILHQNKELWARILESKYRGWRSLVEGERVNKESFW